MYNNILDVKGLKVGQVEDEKALTGCTVVICENGATCGVDVRGSAPGTRETDLLDPINSVQKVHAVVLSGGSAFGLESTCGVSKYLEEKNIGFDVGVCKVPIVTGAVLFDLAVGDYKVRPDKEMGYKACLNASKTELKQGNYGLNFFLIRITVHMFCNGLFCSLIQTLKYLSCSVFTFICNI